MKVNERLDFMMIREPLALIVDRKITEQMGCFVSHDLTDPVKNQANLFLGMNRGPHLDHVSEGPDIRTEDDRGRDSLGSKPAHKARDLLLLREGHPFPVNVIPLSDPSDMILHLPDKHPGAFSKFIVPLGPFRQPKRYII